VQVAVTLEKLDRVPWKQLFKEGVSPVAANYAALTPPPPQKKVRVCAEHDAHILFSAGTSRSDAWRVSCVVVYTS
jgi:hypothetical protein